MIRAYDEYGNVVDLIELERQIRTTNKEEWSKIFKKYLVDYDAIHKLNKDGIIEFEHMQTLLTELLESIITDFRIELNE